MAHTVTILNRSVDGNYYTRDVKVVCTGTYTTGGEVLTLAELEMPQSGVIKTAQCTLDGDGTDVTLGYQPAFKTSTRALMLFRTDQVDDAGEEVANGADIDPVAVLVSLKYQ